MKYLIIASPGLTPVPVEQGADLLKAASVWIKGKLEDGSLDCHYSYFGGGGMGIANAESHAELLANILAYPLYPFFEWEVTPLMEYEGAYEEYAGFYQRMAG